MPASTNTQGFAQGTPKIPNRSDLSLLGVPAPAVLVDFNLSVANQGTATDITTTSVAPRFCGSIQRGKMAAIVGPSGVGGVGCEDTAIPTNPIGNGELTICLVVDLSQIPISGAAQANVIAYMDTVTPAGWALQRLAGGGFEFNQIVGGVGVAVALGANFPPGRQVIIVRRTAAGDMNVRQNGGTLTPASINLGIPDAIVPPVSFFGVANPVGALGNLEIGGPSVLDFAAVWGTRLSDAACEAIEKTVMGTP